MLQMVQAGGMLNMVASVFGCVSVRLSDVVDVCRRKGGQIDSHVIGDVWLIADKHRHVPKAAPQRACHDEEATRGLKDVLAALM
jgi:hypothetical protein